MFYVYEWVRPDYNLAFYVGKGRNNRAWSMSDRNKSTINIINELKEKGLKHEVRIISYFINEKSSFDFEKERIKFLKPLGELTNQTPGGQGMSGYKHTQETKNKLSLIAKNGKHVGLTVILNSPEIIRKRALKTQKTKSTPEFIKKYKETNSKEGVRLKRSRSLKIALNKPEAIEKLSKAKSGANNPKAKIIIELSDLKIFMTIKDAQEFYGLHNISAVCRGKRKTSSGRRFMYLKDYQANLKAEGA
jgi:hypothetical protein